MAQGSLPFVEKKEEVPDVTILRCRDLKAAIRLCYEVSGLPLKELAFHLEIDERHLTRMMANNPNDQRHFPQDALQRLMDVCQNEIPLRWLALTRGYGLHKLKSELEVENETLRRQLQEQQREMETVKKWMKEIRAA